MWRWLVYHLSGSHVSRCVVSATASSRHRAFALSQLEIECKNPLPLSLAEFLVSAALVTVITCDPEKGGNPGNLITQTIIPGVTN